MAAKKGEIPAHVKKKEFSHPNAQHPIIYIIDCGADYLLPVNAVSKETSMKGGIATRQYAASFNPVYRDRILKNLF